MEHTYEIAQQAVADGNPHNAIRHITAHLTQHPNDPNAWVSLASLRFDTNDPDRAQKSLDRAFELRPDLPLAWLEKGRWAFRTGEWKKADDAISQAIALGLEESSAYAFRGMARRRMAKFDLARADFERALKLNPYQEDAIWHLRMFDEQQHAREEGTWVTIAVHFDPDWLFMVKSMLLDQGIPTKISEQDAVFNLDASTDYNRKLQVRLEESEQAFWAVYDWARDNDYQAEPEAEAMEIDLHEGRPLIRPDVVIGAILFVVAVVMTYLLLGGR